MTKLRNDNFTFGALILIWLMFGIVFGSMTHDWIYHPDIKHYVIKGSE